MNKAWFTSRSRLALHGSHFLAVTPVVVSVIAGGRAAVPVSSENRAPATGCCLRKTNTHCQIKFKLLQLTSIVR